MSTTIRLDVVAPTEDLPQYKVYRGQVGTVVEPLAPGVFEIDFSDDEGAPTLRWPYAPTSY